MQVVQDSDACEEKGRIQLLSRGLNFLAHHNRCCGFIFLRGDIWGGHNCLGGGDRGARPEFFGGRTKHYYGSMVRSGKNPYHCFWHLTFVLTTQK